MLESLGLQILVIPVYSRQSSTFKSLPATQKDTSLNPCGPHRGLLTTNLQATTGNQIPPQACLAHLTGFSSL